MLTTRFRLIATITIAAILLLLPAAAQPPDGTPGPPPGTPEPGPSNGSGANGNATRGPPAGTPGPPTERPGPPVDPVAIRDNATGFRTEAPAGSKRPEFTLDAGRGLGTLARPDIHPMHIQLDSLVEFVDENGNRAYDMGEPVITRIQLSNASFKIDVNATAGTRDVVYPLDGGGTLILRFHIASVPAPSVGAKFDVILLGYPFASNDTLVAFGLRVDSPAGLQHARVADEAAVVGVRGDETPYLSWEGEVLADGASRPVGTSVHLAAATAGGAPESAIVYWAYPQGEVILHDPILGVTSGIIAVLGDLTPFLAGLLGAVALLGIGYAARRGTRL